MSVGDGDDGGGGGGCCCSLWVALIGPVGGECRNASKSDDTPEMRRATSVQFSMVLRFSEAVLALVRNKYVTGEVFVVDGGLTQVS